jgi:hypothetical protein
LELLDQAVRGSPVRPLACFLDFKLEFQICDLHSVHRLYTLYCRGEASVTFAQTRIQLNFHELHVLILFRARRRFARDFVQLLDFDHEKAHPFPKTR